LRRFRYRSAPREVHRCHRRRASSAGAVTAGALAAGLAGVYAPGQRLPSIADLVGEYGIARDTALKAQRVLIADGLAVNSPGMGLFVAGR
jgi:DNA-binding FadR family transcriptional regulator